MSKRSPTSISAINDDGGTPHSGKKTKVEVSFGDLLPKLEGISKEDIISCLAQAWKSSGEKGTMKPSLVKAVNDVFDEEEERMLSPWGEVESPSMILDYNWKQVDGEKEMNIKDANK